MKKQSNPTPDQPRPKPAEKPEKVKPPARRKKEGPSRLSRILSAVGKKLFLIIIAIVVVFTAAVAGAVITYRVEHDVWEKKLAHKENLQLADKRIELMERTIAMMSRGKVVKEMDEDYRKTTLASVAKVGLDPSKIVDVIGKTMKERSLSRCEVMESRSDYDALLRLDAIMFGDRTKAAVTALLAEDPWYNADDKLRENLIEAMEADFYEEPVVE
ncbi:MAG: hypothetical protein JSU61_05875 [Fidelibacterota bacterium]|nr:MAG: hypothetical protein JSU61_05875 [Candidatus Neomarinimicrobiota bacterium]